jgi:UDP-2-acetamido-3-amino-2,3-dideoxy-glucuronate N-acetyltransferase
MPEAVHDAPAIHPSATVEDGAIVGPGTRVWHRSHVRAGSVIGAACTIGFAVYVDTEVVVGDGCKIQNHANLYRGLTLGDDVFVGPAVTFTNDLHPRADAGEWTVVPTFVDRGASVGANATVVCGIRIGAHAMVGAGAVVTADVAPHALVMGAPARQVGWVCVCGHTLARTGSTIPDTCASCGRTTEGIAR